MVDYPIQTQESGLGNSPSNFDPDITYVYLTEKGFWQLIEAKHPDEELFSSAKGPFFKPRRYF